jgi:hypothetical protein
MTTITAPASWDQPTGDTPALDMTGTYYGVRMDEIGEDGDVIALGHVGVYRMTAALRRHAREVWGEDLARPGTHRVTLVDITARIALIWMVNVGGSSQWDLRWAEPTSPGAFPVTYWTA